MAKIDVLCPPCQFCGEQEVMEVEANGYGKWRAGMLVQQAFPELSDDDRELLISGTHPACWDKYVKLDD